MPKAPDINKKCKFCGIEGFRWKQVGLCNWQLVDAVGHIHACSNIPKRERSKEQRNCDMMRDFGITTSRIRSVEKFFRYAKRSRIKQEE